MGNNFDRQYKKLIATVLQKGTERIVKAGAKTLSIHGEMIKHDLSEGFPLTTLRKIPFRLIASELEWILKGRTDKKWLQERDNHIWDHWANPQKAAYAVDPASIENMSKEDDLGPIYGFQWRHFGAEYENHNTDYLGRGFDQIQFVLDRMHRKPFSKNLLVSSWNPIQLDQMSIPPCSFSFQIIRHGDNLNLSFYQRSVDAMLGLPFDFASYTLLLHLFSLEAQLKPGSVVGFFNNVEIFEQHTDTARELINRESKHLPSLKTDKFTSINDWVYTDTVVENYDPNPGIAIKVNI